ncbi:uncharacterized protein DUF1499 [Phaeovulum veldkampii DSM 11550]|nr:uncharacterized protein DUF1499 [Phaeovulum veldkampii DSM 11550]
MMTKTFLFALFVVLAIAAGMAWVRLAPLDATLWHVNPAIAIKRDSPNDYLLRPVGGTGGDAVAPVWATDPVTLAQRLVAAALAEPRTRILAGGADQGFVTLVQRSALWGFPDMISIRTDAAPGGATAAIWSRARFGYSDMGVNEARVQRWLAAATEGLAVAP